MSRATANQVERAVRGYLRDTYGITEIYHDKGRGGHSKMSFRYRGEPQTISLPNSPSDLRWEEIKQADIRRQLGEPPPRPPEAKLTLEEMTMELQTKAAELHSAATAAPTPPPIPTQTWHGRAMAYMTYGNTRSWRLQIVIPEAIALSLREGVDVEPLDRGKWLITARDDGHRKPRRVGENTHLIEINGPHLLPGLDPPFGSTKIEIERRAPGEYLAELTEEPAGIDANRQRVAKRSGTAAAPTREPSARGEPPAPTPTPPTGTEDPAPAAESTASTKVAKRPTVSPSRGTHGVDDLRVILELIAAAEHDTAYRLVKLKDDAGWAWRAPLITLDDGMKE